MAKIDRRPMGRPDHAGFRRTVRRRRTTAELQRWVDAARRGTIDGPGTWDGYAAVAVCEAGVEALRTGEKVAVRLGSPSSVGEPDPGIAAPDLIAGRP